MKRSTSFVAGTVLLALLAIVDVASIAGDNGPEPEFVVVIGLVLGLATLAGLILAWRGRTAGTVVAVSTRVLSALTALPAFGAGEAGTALKVAVSIFVVATVLGVVLLTEPLRSGRRTTAAQGS